MGMGEAGVGVTAVYSSTACFSDRARLTEDAVLRNATMSSSLSTRRFIRMKKNIMAASAQMPRITPIAIPALAPSVRPLEVDGDTTEVSPAEEAIAEETAAALVRPTGGIESVRLFVAVWDCVFASRVVEGEVEWVTAMA